MPQDTVSDALAVEPARPLGPDNDRLGQHGHGRTGFGSMMLGSIGVVYGDIGTSPLYALKCRC